MRYFYIGIKLFSVRILGIFDIQESGINPRLSEAPQTFQQLKALATTGRVAGRAKSRQGLIFTVRFRDAPPSLSLLLQHLKTMPTGGPAYCTTGVQDRHMYKKPPKEPDRITASYRPIKKPARKSIRLPLTPPGRSVSRR